LLTYPDQCYHSFVPLNAMLQELRVYLDIFQQHCI
jgi:hypothetical protein